MSSNPTLTTCLAILMLSGCPDFGSMVYRIDLAAKRVTVVIRDLRTDDPDDAIADFATIVEAVADPDEDVFTDAHAEMVEEGGELVVRWEATYSDLSTLDVYQHDRRSPYLWCVDRPHRSTVSSTTGTVPEELPGCVVFDRKTKVLEFAVRQDVSDTASLLPQFHALKARD